MGEKITAEKCVHHKGTVTELFYAAEQANTTSSHRSNVCPLHTPHITLLPTEATEVYKVFIVMILIHSTDIKSSLHKR